MNWRDERARRRWVKKVSREWITRPDARCIITFLHESVRPGSGSVSRIKESRPDHFTIEPESIFNRNTLISDLHSLAQAAGASMFTVTDQVSGQVIRVYAVVSTYGHDDAGKLIAPVSDDTVTVPVDKVN